MGDFKSHLCTCFPNFLQLMWITYVIGKRVLSIPHLLLLSSLYHGSNILNDMIYILERRALSFD